MRPRAKFGPVEQVEPGKPYVIKPRRDGKAIEYEVCCDCSLVHLVEYVVVDKGIQVRVWRDDSKTNELRKKSGTPK